MSDLKRAHTWEISDSENESDEIKASSGQDTRASLCAARTGRSGGGVREDSVKSPGRRRTPEEIQQDQERRNTAREKKREEKRRRQEEKLQEQQRRRETAERLNLLKPENLIKSLTIHIHALLLQNAGCDVLIRTIDGLVWRNHIEDQGLHNSIRWTRPVLQAEEEDGHGDVEEDQVLMVISHDEFNHAVMSHKRGTSQLAPIGEVNEGAGSLLQHLSEYLTRSAGKVVTILVINHHQRAGSWNEDDVDSYLYHQNLDTEEEQLLVHLQFHWNVAVYFLFGWEEVTDHVIAVTKALSKRPYKAVCGDPELGFCTDASWSGGVHVEKDGHGLAQVWTRQIQQLNRVSAPTAKAVTTTYPSPSLLLQAYEELSSEEEKRRLLADLPVGGGAKERRVGPDLSGRIRRLLTSQNPHLLLD